ncbi:MAG: hypothetical protein ACKVH8_21345 [Pirellulales bacterium]|jgi:hypothetical protein
MKARRKELKNIAGGIVGSFISRNNDIDGYWGLGILYRFANQRQVDMIQLDLLNLTITPASTKFYPIVRYWNAKLEYHIERRSIPRSWLQSVIVTTKFNQEYEEKYHAWRSALGDPCLCTCEIKVNDGRVYSVTVGTNCWPHDPEREMRRGGYSIL